MATDYIEGEATPVEIPLPTKRKHRKSEGEFDVGELFLHELTEIDEFQVPKGSDPWREARAIFLKYRVSEASRELSAASGDKVEACAVEAQHEADKRTLEARIAVLRSETLRLQYAVTNAIRTDQIKCVETVDALKAALPRVGT